MKEMDRRAFLLGSGALMTVSPPQVAGQVSGQLPSAEHPMAPPVAAAKAKASLPAFVWEASGQVFTFAFVEDRLRCRHVLPGGVAEPAALPAPDEIAGLEVALSCTGEDTADHHGAKLTGGLPGTRLRYVDRCESVTATGKRLVVTHSDALLALKVESVYEAWEGIPVVRRSTRLRNSGTASVGIEYVSSAMLHNFAAPGELERVLRIHFAYNSWQAEAQWHTVRPSEIGLVDNGNFTVSGATWTTIGSWPCQTYLPMVIVENCELGVAWFWQIEHNGSWHAEMAQSSSRALYAYLGGPDAQHAQAWKKLAPGETYDTIPVAIGCVRGGFSEAIAALTQYRRATHRAVRRDMRACPVIFNDVAMLDGNQTTAAELPLVEAASAVGCEIYCMDVGWYTKPGENWWAPVGDWRVNQDRFPGGFDKLLEAIRARGMEPGIWIEPEVAGLHSSLSRKPDSWFFTRHGRRVIDHTRYQLDFRKPEVRAYIDAAFARLITGYGIRYIKLDYNINALEGTEQDAESFGQGLLGHNRAFLAWFDALLTRYPNLTVEAVASGGMRMEYSVLSRAQLQSISDQDDYRTFASLTTGCSAALLPEQMGVWSQPMAGATPEVTSANMVGAMLGRIHQTGFLPVLSPESLAQVKLGITVYKQEIRRYIPTFTPFYPLGMSLITNTAEPAALGMQAHSRDEKRTFVAVWRREGPERVLVPGLPGSMRLLYPLELGIHASSTEGGIEVSFPHSNMACILTT